MLKNKLYIGLGLPDGSIAVMQKNKKGLIGTIKFHVGRYILSNESGKRIGMSFTVDEALDTFEHISNKTKRNRTVHVLESAILTLTSTPEDRWNKHARIYLSDLVRELNSMP